MSLPLIRCALALRDRRERAINKFLLTFIIILFIVGANKTIAYYIFVSDKGEIMFVTQM